MAVLDNVTANNLCNHAERLGFWQDQVTRVALTRPCMLSKQALGVRIREMERHLTALRSIHQAMPDD